MSDDTTKNNETRTAGETDQPNPDASDADDDQATEPENAQNEADASPTDSLDEETEVEAERLVQTREEMEELINELRAEVTRLKVEQAKAQTKTWMQRHPGWTALLSVGIGVAAGYGAAKWTQPEPRPRLSDRAREGLKHLADTAKRTASDVSVDLEDRAARAGEEAREIGRRLLEDAERAGVSAGERARQWSREAARLARELGEEAGEKARETAAKAQEEGSKRARDIGSRLAEDVDRAEEEISRRAKETADQVRESVGSKSVSVRQSATGLLALVAGSWLAKKVREIFS